MAEGLRRQIAVARHEGKLGIHLPDQQEFRAAGLARVQHVEREIGIAAQAETVAAPGHQLAHDVDAARHQVIGGMGVVGGDIAALRRRVAEPAAGEKEELVHPDIRRQGAAMLRRGVVERRIAAQQAFRDRRQEPPLQFALRRGGLEREGGEDVQLDRSVLHRAAEQRIGDMVRLAQAERQAEHDPAPHLRDDGVCQGVRIGKGLGHAHLGAGRADRL